MAWKETVPVDERVRFIAKWKSGDFSVVELCREFGISRKTAYKFIGRYKVVHKLGEGNYDWWLLKLPSFVVEFDVNSSGTITRYRK